MAEEACAGNLQAGFCEEGPLQLRGPLLAPGGAIPPGYSPGRHVSYPGGSPGGARGGDSDPW